MSDFARRPASRHNRGSRFALAAYLAVSLATGACSTDKKLAPEAIQLPAVSSLRAAANILVADVETNEGPPKWLHREREVGGYIYGIGIQSGGRGSAQDLHLAMHAARRTVVVWLESRGAGAGAPASLLPPMQLDPEQIDFERIARNTRNNRWYALARLDVARESAELRTAVADLEREITQARAELNDSSATSNERLRAALSIVYDVDRRKQLDAIYHALTHSNLTPPAGLEDTALLDTATGLLSSHGVRVVVEGRPVAGLHETVSSAIGEVQLRSDEFGRSLVTVRLIEGNEFEPSDPYLKIEGHVEWSIESGEGPSLGTPFHVVSTGDSLEEARFRAARTIHQEVARILRETLRTLGGTESP
jgi:hypothetical protein